MKYVFKFRETSQNVMNRIGGKGASLVRLTSLGMPVPPGYVISADSFLDGSIREDALTEIKAVVAALDSSRTFAVRSSALNEDGDNASFAGQYETITNVKTTEVIDAIKSVVGSARSSRVEKYTESRGSEYEGIGIVIQEFVKPEFAGVIFTSDVITRSSKYMVGNYVKGEGELLVSGAANASEFKMNCIKYAYEGNDEFRKYARILYKYCSKIRDYYKSPMDIEWAVSGGKVYILQARPITTLKRIDLDAFNINGSMSDESLLTKTNVGEIFMSPVSPMTYSVLELINTMLDLPCALDFINGQAYMNISVICSMMVSLGVSEKKAFENIRDLVGNMPEGITVPIHPFDKNKFLKNLFRLFTGKLNNYGRTKMSRRDKSEMIRNLPDIARSMADSIRSITTNEELYKYWTDVMMVSLNDGLSAVLTECGTQMVPLFSMRNKITKVAGEEMANKLLSGCVGILDSMKPLLLLEDVKAGRMSRDEYMKICGQRCVNEMELSMPRPYENPSYLDDLIANGNSGADLYSMRKSQEEKFDAALKEFDSLYPKKSKWIRVQIEKFKEANQFREDIRSKGVWIFSVLREFLLCAGKINGIGDDIFMLYLDECMKLLKGDKSVLKFIEGRKLSHEKNLSYPDFPGLILGEFNPEIWMKDPLRRNDFYCATKKIDYGADVKGFPGASGVVEGVARIITDISHIDELIPGEILVTTATNIGWTVAFGKVSAIVTDIGAPLSHAAIVAREFGIPAVVGCGNATTVIKSGDRIVVDGTNGTVSKV